MDYEREIPFGVFDSELMHQEISIPDGFTATIEGDKIILTRTESEDEKIRKAIHIYLDWLDGRKDYAPKGKYTIKDMISWLKKHGEPTDINPSEFDLRLNKLLKQFETLSKEELTSSLSFYLNVVQNDGTYKAEEKQGEQKPTDKVEPKFKVGDKVIGIISGMQYYITKVCDNHYCTESGCIIMFDAQDNFELVEQQLKKIEQKSTDKVEPKFHKGEWVVQENIGVYKVIEVCESWYEVVDNKDKHYSIGFDKEYMCHLYTIKDAKDGDVLATPNYLYIFNSIDKETETVSFYCLMKKSDEHFSFGDYKIHDEILNSTPATQEQCDLLFAKMEEAGYKWDTESKELKKIEQKPAWSEEDKKKLNRIYMLLAEAAYEHAFSTTCRLIGDNECVELQDFLKSLRPQKQWKPTKDQMEALHDLNLTGNISYTGQGQVLIELYNDLYKISNVKDK